MIFFLCQGFWRPLYFYEECQTGQLTSHSSHFAECLLIGSQNGALSKHCFLLQSLKVCAWWNLPLYKVGLKFTWSPWSVNCTREASASRRFFSGCFLTTRMVDTWFRFCKKEEIPSQYGNSMLQQLDRKGAIMLLSGSRFLRAQAT